MEPTRVDVIVYVYTLGTVLTGGLLVKQLGIQANPLLVGVSLLAAVAWTVYFRVAMFPRLEDELTEDETETDAQA
ncbi:hypothetical protein [Haloarchaeobius sp. TZWSO28]|uniref:hypothetical protein n=1 Tax=unclassified Haloarchaeobius TaxID=2614452 RepID=UPI003EBFF12C